VVYQYSPSGRGDALAPSSGSLSGTLSAPGGPSLRDAFGRQVVLHGVDAVYKRPPYELYPDPGTPWNFDAADAERIASLGFNVVRLGIEWEGIEPGVGGPNSPSVCAPGPPGNPGELDLSVARRYLSHVAQTVDLLGRYGIYTLLDMHQDVYNHLFLGEGAPDWAVCTDGQPIRPVGGRWSRNYADPVLDIAEEHFWQNDVVGNLQGQFDLVWAIVAHYFRDNPWILGYDPYNEPFSQELTEVERQSFAQSLECFYTGTAHPALEAATDQPMACPADDPAAGLIPTIEAADPHHLVFLEPDLYTEPGLPALLEPMDYPRLVYNFHVYCPQRSAVTGNPTDVVLCWRYERASMLRKRTERSALATAVQPGGPAWFMSEFGATSSEALVSRLVHEATGLGLGWSYYSWKYYQDPTGSSSEALVTASGTYSPVVAALSSTYPQAVAGRLVSDRFSPRSGTFRMAYVPRGAGPTSIFVAGGQHYPAGWCTAVLGGVISSAPGADHLVVVPLGQPHEIRVSVTPGRCPAPS